MCTNIPDHLLLVMIRTLMVDTDKDLKKEVLNHLLRQTNIESQIILDNMNELLGGLFHTLESDNSNREIASMCLINIAAKDKGHTYIFSYLQKNHAKNNSESLVIISKMIEYINKEASQVANAILMLLCNLTREKNYAYIIFQSFDEPFKTLELLMKLFIMRDLKEEKNYDYISYLLSNLCQLHDVRIWLMDSGSFPKLLSFLNHNSSIRRAGVIMTIKNCCFELDRHLWLLSEDLDLLSRLLLPLAGPEQFDDEDNENLPLDLQYLPEDKERESDPNLRLAILQALTQLCAKKDSREIIRNQGTYLILRELHKWEPNMDLKLACENIVDILIKTEDEIGTDNFHELNVPEELIPKFKQMDEAYLS
ncbi:protein HGH1 homolog [Daktulosphaira vitifoliae]|uniref:protein HGH1 homolog n=1 Tax=Daktulosphaira vitifoliae TaxID=58002 RepID=UPI0021AA2C92|nr:protein HGH1 homolog [Daktulosphaira vitifoliae]